MRRRAVVAIVSEGAGESAWYSSELALIDPVARTARTLRRSEVQLGWACGSPAGTHAAVIEAVCSDRMIVAGELLLIDPASGEARTVDTHGVDVTWTAWRDDERLFAIGVRGLEPVALDVRAADATADGDLGRIRLLRRELLPVRIADRPGQGVRGGASVAWDRAHTVGTRRRRSERTLADLAHAGTTARRELIGDRRRVRWSAPDGLEIEGFLTLPRGEGPFPTILHVHGGPIWTFQDTPPNEIALALIERGYAIFDPNVRGSTGRGREFASLVVGDMGGGDVGDMLSGLDHLVAEGLADADRLGIMGVSYGGLHGVLAADAGRALQGLGRHLPGHELVQRALRQQPRRLGRRLPRRRAEARRRPVLRPQSGALRRAPTARPPC